MTKVLAAVDEGPCGAAVLEAARAIATLFGAEVVALHIPEDAGEAPRRLARDAGVELQEHAGSPTATIVAAVEDPEVVSLVLGTRASRHGPRPAGHTALAVVTQVRKPVLLVPPDWAGHPTIRRVLVPLEGSQDSSSAIADVLALMRGSQIEVVALHVHTPQTVPPFRDQPEYDIPLWQSEFAARFVSVTDLRLEVVERVGETAAQVVRVAKDMAADLIVLAWNRRLDPGRAKVVSETLAAGDTPVLLVPTP